MGCDSDSDSDFEFEEHEMCEEVLAAWTLIKMANSTLVDDQEQLQISTTTNTTLTKPNRINNNAKKRKDVDLTAATPEMPGAMRDRIGQMGGDGIRLVIQKQLYDTDLNKNQGRLSLSIKKLKFDFVTEEEAALLGRTEGKKKLGLDVPVVDPALRESVICLKKWKIGSDDVYCLMTHWNTFAKQNNLKSGQVVQLWSFRKQGVDVANQNQLCFAITTPSLHLFQ